MGQDFAVERGLVVLQLASRRPRRTMLYSSNVHSASLMTHSQLTPTYTPKISECRQNMNRWNPYSRLLCILVD